MTEFTYEVSQEDQESLARNKNHPVRVYLELRSRLSFKPGDVLIKYDLNNWSTPPSKKIVNVSDTFKVPKKFQVVFIDDLGIPYIKLISSQTGKWAESPMVPIVLQDLTCVQFDVDPLFVESIIFGTEYVAYPSHKDHKKDRQKMLAANKKLFTRITSQDEYEAFIAQVNVGDTFWQNIYSSNYEFKVTGKKTFTDAKDYASSSMFKNTYIRGGIPNQVNQTGPITVIEVNGRDHYIWGAFNNTGLSIIKPRGLNDDQL